jgi:hypothetical protein
MADTQKSSYDPEVDPVATYSRTKGALMSEEPEQDQIAQEAYVFLYPMESPGADREPNWLPASQRPLGVTLRLYGPRPEILDGRWNPPPLELRRARATT